MVQEGDLFFGMRLATSRTSIGSIDWLPKADFSVHDLAVRSERDFPYSGYRRHHDWVASSVSLL